jgi:hypothetical protein
MHVADADDVLDFAELFERSESGIVEAHGIDER